MNQLDFAFWLDHLNRGLHRVSGYLREVSARDKRYKPAFYAVNRALTELDAAVRELRDAECEADYKCSPNGKCRIHGG